MRYSARRRSDGSTPPTSPTPNDQNDQGPSNLGSNSSSRSRSRSASPESEIDGKKRKRVLNDSGSDTAEVAQKKKESSRNGCGAEPSNLIDSISEVQMNSCEFQNEDAGENFSNDEEQLENNVQLNLSEIDVAEYSSIYQVHLESSGTSLCLTQPNLTAIQNENQQAATSSIGENMLLDAIVSSNGQSSEEKTIMPNIEMGEVKSNAIDAVFGDELTGENDLNGSIDISHHLPEISLSPGESVIRENGVLKVTKKYDEDCEITYIYGVKLTPKIPLFEIKVNDPISMNIPFKENVSF